MAFYKKEVGYVFTVNDSETGAIVCQVTVDAGDPLVVMSFPGNHEESIILNCEDVNNMEMMLGAVGDVLRDTKQ